MPLRLQEFLRPFYRNVLRFIYPYSYELSENQLFAKKQNIMSHIFFMKIYSFSRITSH